MAHTYSAAARREMRNEAQAFIDAHPTKFRGREILVFVHTHGDNLRLAVTFRRKFNPPLPVHILVPCSQFDTMTGPDYGLLVRMVKEHAPLPTTFRRSR